MTDKTKTWNPSPGDFAWCEHEKIKGRIIFPLDSDIPKVLFWDADAQKYAIVSIDPVHWQKYDYQDVSWPKEMYEIAGKWWYEKGNKYTREERAMAILLGLAHIINAEQEFEGTFYTICPHGDEKDLDLRVHQSSMRKAAIIYFHSYEAAEHSLRFFKTLWETLYQPINKNK